MIGNSKLCSLFPLPFGKRAPRLSAPLALFSCSVLGGYTSRCLGESSGSASRRTRCRWVLSFDLGIRSFVVLSLEASRLAGESESLEQPAKLTLSTCPPAPSLPWRMPQLMAVVPTKSFPSTTAAAATARTTTAGSSTRPRKCALGTCVDSDLLLP